MTGSQPPRKPRVFGADDPDLEVFRDEDAELGDDAGAGSGTENAGASSARSQSSAELPDDMVLVEKAEEGDRRWGWGSVLISALTSLFLLASGIWFAHYVSIAIQRDDWIGYLAMGLAALAAFAAAVLVLREIIGMWRLARLSGLRKDAEAALRQKDMDKARAVTSRLKRIAGRPRDKRWDLQRFREEERHMRNGPALLGLADRVLLAPADKEARTIVYESARRVAVATAVIPIMFLAVLFVLRENLRMTRRLATAYGGRPGFFGGLRLFWWILTHLAATGAIAFTDDLFGQFLGQDVAHRVSRRLGEGAFNGAMTARLGVAAIALTRPLPFIEAAPPRIRSILVELFPELNPADLISGVFGRRQTEPNPRKS